MKKICDYINVKGDDVVCTFYNECTILGTIATYDGSKCKNCWCKDFKKKYLDTDTVSQKEIKVKYIHPVSKIEVHKIGDWVDLRCAKNMCIKKGEFAIIPLGVAIKLPEGYEALLVPRSSTFKRYGLIQTNGIGIIDESYCGDDDEWGMPVYATEDTVIPFDVRVCQFRIIRHQPVLNIETANTLHGKNRGGFGSTGEN